VTNAEQAFMVGERLCREQAVFMAFGQDHLLGILSEPAAPACPSGTGVLIVGGGAQYRAGSHRQFVRLARQLAGAGHAVMRFDFSGLGDSSGTVLNFEALTGQIGAALDHFQRLRPELRRFVLWGLCDGASASLLYLHQTRDARVHGLSLLNPWVRSEAGLARAHVKHYYRERLFSPEFWSKLLRGQVRWRSWRSLLRNIRRSFAHPPSPQSYLNRMLQAWQSFDGHTLLLLSERDLTAQEFVEHARMHARWAECMASPLVQQHVLPGADHTCSSPASSRLVQELTQQWLAASLPAEFSASSSASAPIHPGR